MKSTPPAALRAALAALVAVIGPMVPRAASADDQNELTTLRRQLDALEQRLAALDHVSPPAEKPPTVTAGPGGFSLRSADRDFELRLRANIQADARFFVGDAVPGNDTFLLRRVRPSFEGTVAGQFGFRIMPDFAGSSVTLLDAYATYQYSPALGILVGKAKSPFDLERLVSQTDLLFLERGYPTSLAPNRDVGVQIFGELAAGRLTYQLSWLNGARDNDSSVADADDDKDLVLRLFAQPFKNDASSWLRGLGLGVAASAGERSGAPNSYRTNAQQTFFAWRSSTLNGGSHQRFEPQFHFYRGPFGLIGSWIWSEQELTTAGSGGSTARLANTAWFLAAHYVLTGEDATLRGVTPKRAFAPADHAWGAWEIAARIGQLDIDDDVFPVFADPATAATRVTGGTLGVNWHVNRNVKASLNFEYSDFDGGAAGAVTRESERAILTRLQLRY